MYEMRPVRGGAVPGRRPLGKFPAGFLAVVAVFGFVALASGSYFPFFPLVPLFLVFIFFTAPAIGRPAPPRSDDLRGVPEARPTRANREKELLGALERHPEVTAARAALETSLTVAEAEAMLAELAAGGHVEVRAREGALAYALRASDRREALLPKGLASPDGEAAR